MFQIGESVCYPMHGVGVVEGIEEKNVLGENTRYYVLRFFASRLTAMVPVDAAEGVGLRRVIDAGQCAKVLQYMHDEPPCEESDNWNQRYRDNLAKLKGGDIFEVADVVKCLKKRDMQKGLSAGDRKMLITARQVLVAELSAASGRDIDELREIIG